MTNKDDSWQTCNMDERTNEQILLDSVARLQSEVAELRKERDDLIAALKKSDDEYLKLQQRLAGQVPDGWRCFHCDEVFTTKESARAHFGVRLMDVPECQTRPESAAEWILKCREIATDRDNLRAKLEARDANPAPTSAGVPDEIKRAIRSAKTAMNMWENGYAFDTHGRSRDIQREIEIADTMLSAQQPAADGGGE